MKWNKGTLTGTMRTVKMVRSKGYTQNKREIARRLDVINCEKAAIALSGRLIL